MDLVFTFRAKTQKQHFVSCDLIVRLPHGGYFQPLCGLDHHIVDAAAFKAADMIVNLGIAVKALLAPTTLYFLDIASFDHALQVPIDRSQADLWQTFADYRVQLIRCRMRMRAPQLLQNDLSLPGNALCGLF